MHPVLVARTLLTGSVLAALVAACGSAAVASPTGNSAVAASPTVAATPEPTVFGPTAFADWTERQGFGGSDGLHNVSKLAAWLVDHAYDATPFDLASDSHDIDGLISWLDAHPATACWTAYHATVRASLETLAAGYVQARAARAAGRSVPIDLAASMRDVSQQAYALATPADCP